MKANPLRFGTKITNLLAAWGRFAPETKFAGMALAEFKSAIAPSVDSRSQIDDIRLQIKGLIAQRATADSANSALMARVVAGVLADADHGPNSGLYRALNYVPKNERASGLTHKGATTTAAANAGTTASNSTTPSTH